MMITLHLPPIHEAQIPADARGSEVGIIMLLRLFGTPQRVVKLTGYTIQRIYQVKKKFGI